MTQDNFKHTPGPWYADECGDIWRRHPTELHENGGGVAGDKPLAQARIGWRGIDQQGYPVEQNARLIAAAPDLLEALKGCFEHMEWSTPQGKAACFAAQAAIFKATGDHP